MLAIQIAALRALKGMKGHLQLESYDHLFQNLDLLHAISVAGIAPIIFGLLILHLSGMRSTFIYFLTAVTFSLSLATRFFDNIITFAPEDIVGPRRIPKNCGGNPSPARYCSSVDPSDRLADYQQSWEDQLVFIVSLLTLIMLFFNQFLRIRSPIYLSEAEEKWVTLYQWLRICLTSRPRLQFLGQYRRLDCITMSVVLSIFTQFFLFSLQLAIILMLLWHFTILQELSTEINSHGGDWTLGQIIAVTVLFPPIVEYIYLAIR